MAELTKKRSRRITPEDVLQVARLVARKRMTEKEACLLMGIKPENFYVWKARAKHTEKFDNVLAHETAIRIDGLFDAIEDKGQKDWRMYDRLLERTSDRFCDKKNETPVVAGNFNVNLFLSAAKKIYSVECPANDAKQLSPVDTKQIVDAVPVNDACEKW